MSGWLVVVDSRAPEERDASKDKMDGVLASWESGPFDLAFLTKGLVKQGKASQHSFNGYPSRFTVAAKDLVPLLIDGPPTFDGRTVPYSTIHMDPLCSLQSDHILTVDAWDMS